MNGAGAGGIEHVIVLLTRLASGDYRARGVRDREDEALDAVIVGINMLAEELEARSAELAQRVADLETARTVALEASRQKSAFLATMSHEIRTPMNGVLGLTNLLLATALDERQHQYAEGVHSAGQALLTILNDILDFSKIEAGNLELETTDFDVIQVVHDAAQLVAESALRRGLELLVDCSPSLPTALRGDPSRLRQILLNLVSNAVKFTERGEVVIRGHLDDRTPEGVVARFEVKDTGIGIDQVARERLFLPFTQADASTTRRFGGTGLGLAISQQLVAAMGGEMGMDSEPECGSTFWFTVPLALADEVAQSSPPESLLGVRVLVVDDNDNSRLILHRQLTAWGMRPDAVPTGGGALRALEVAVVDGDPYTWVLADARMPHMDGLGLVRRIRQGPDIADVGVVLLTSASDIGPEEARAAGFATSLTKPVHPSRLQTVLLDVEANTRKLGDLALDPPVHEDSRRPARGRGHVLVVDDNHVNQMVAVGMLEQLGYTAEVAGNGLEALAALDRTIFAVILMDCHMPEMDGYTATRAVRQRERMKRTPIIAMTAFTTEGERERCLAAGMDDFLAKPVVRESLETKLQNWINTPRREVPDADTNAKRQRAEPVIDEKRLDMLRDIDPGGPALLLQVLEEFLSSAPEQVDLMLSAVRERAPHDLESAAHELKESALSMGAGRVAAICDDLEQIGRTGGLHLAGSAMSQLVDEVDRAASALRSHVPDFST